MRQAIARFRQASVAGFPASDVALAGLVGVVAVASVLTGNPDEGPMAVTLPVAIVSAVALLWRQRTTLLTAGLVAAAGLVQTLLAQPHGSLWSLAVYAIAMYSLAAWSAELVAAIAGAVVVAVLLIEERIDNGVDYVFILLMFGGVWLLGRASRHWRGRVTAVEQRQREVARLAVAEERVRIAREVHDVIAHSLGVIAVQSDAAEAALAVDAARATAPVRAIRETARGALAEIRRVLDVLRADDADLPGNDSPGIAAITALVESARASGLRLRSDVQVTSAPLPRHIDLAGYRIVQECLTNVLKHAPDSDAVVTVAQTSRILTVRVVSTLPGGAGGGAIPAGYGIRGMRERAAALGGSLRAGPTGDGSFEVAARLPLRTTRLREVP
ncbi:histidine kinase [Microbacterium kribbense]|uniref:histidine kinase n=1 Tax=Microbacterium kribbense TaxID=433645 RepID=A0ABP7GRW2_9MICO